MIKSNGIMATALAFASLMSEIEQPKSRRLVYGYNSAERKSPLTKKQIKSRNKNKASKQARKKQRK